jgi:AcrR family transcriptional regulator
MSANTSADSGARAPVAQRSVERAIERRRATYADEVRRLMQSAFELIRRTGTLEPRVGEIVRDAGLSNQAFYKHFRSKDELLLAVLDDGIGTLRDYLDHRMSKQTSPLHRIRAWISGVLEQALNADAASATRPFAMSRARLLDLFPEEVRESEAQLTRLLRGAIEAAAEAGELPHRDSERDARLIYNLAMGWLERELSDRDAPAPAQADADHLVEFAMRGLARGGE